ncbi:MAG: hypothetical protein JW808_06370 [Victivallales bacterium]|nr:hypothetical protein [Victivallales bacterium]
MNRVLAICMLCVSVFHDAKTSGARNKNTLKNSMKQALKACALMLAPFFTVYSGWTIRNAYSANYNGFSSVGKINIYRYYACQLMAKDNNISFAEQQGICTANLLAQGPQAEQAEYAVKHGLPIIKAQPFRYAMMHIKSDLNSLFPAVGNLCKLTGIKAGEKGTLSVIHTEGIISGVKHYFTGNLWLLVIALPFSAALAFRYCTSTAGAYSVLKPEFNITLLFYLLVAAYLLLIPGAVSHPRFRVPVKPIISILAAVGICNIILMQNKPE